MVDFHVHLFPDRGFDAIWKAFDQVYGVPVLHHLYHRECIDYLRARGIGPMVYSNYAHRKGIAGPMNDWNRAVLDATEDIFCFAAFHPEDDHALDLADDILSHPKVMGIKLHFLIQPFHPDDPRFFPLYERVMKRGKRLLLHIGNGPIGNEFTGMAALRRILDRYPDLPANIPHMGGFEYESCMNLLEDHPGLYLDTAYCFWADMPGGFNLGNEYLEKHRDRILYGSDFPNIILPREGEIEGLLALDLSREFYDRVFRENGRQLIRSVCG
jgi:predicted TIM-barrel fold metal-dependent hydrolase